MYLFGKNFSNNPWSAHLIFIKMLPQLIFLCYFDLKGKMCIVVHIGL